MREGWRGRAAGAGACGTFAAASGIALMASSPATTGCTSAACDPSLTDIYPLTDADDAAANRGFMVDENTFVTNSLDGTWLAYPGNATLRIWFPPEVAGRVPFAATCDVAIAAYLPDRTPVNPNGQFVSDSGINYTQASGQLAEFNDLNTRRTDSAAGSFGGSFEVKNDTCQFYFARCVVSFVPVDGVAPGTDASDDADAGTTAADGDGASE